MSEKVDYRIVPPYVSPLRLVLNKLHGHLALHNPAIIKCFSEVNEMRRRLKWLMFFLALLLFGAAFVIRHFTYKKLGMNRFVAYQQMRINRVFPLSWGKYILLALLLLLMILVIRSFISKKVKGIYVKLPMILMMGALLFDLYFTIFVSAKTVRCYDLMLLCFYGSSLLLFTGNLLQVSCYER